LISLTMDGGAGNDSISGSNGNDTLIGGDGNDFVDGQQGNDTAFLGVGDDVFQWDPGDGSDIVEGQGDIDQLLFNASAANEIIDLAANGQRALLTRNVGNILMDLDDVERVAVNALGGVDALTVNDMTGTDVNQVDINLASTIGGGSGDASADTVVVNGSAGVDVVAITGSGTSLAVNGLAATVNVTNAEGANDKLTVNGQGGNDELTASTLPSGLVQLTLDGGAGNDRLLGSQGADVFLAGDDDDFVFGDNGNDTAFLGTGNDVFEWSPGDGNDIIEGQADVDELRFNGANIAETINIAANGGRILFTRDVASVTMDTDDVEHIRFNAFGGIDNIVIGDLTGTDATAVDLHLAATAGGGDSAADTVTVNGTNVADSIIVAASGGVITASGLTAAVSLFDAEAANDRLVLNANGGDDVVNASTLAAGLIQLTMNGGLGNDLFVGSAGNDVVVGGDGNDTALLGGGNDNFVWNPGDDNDIIEGQAGLDTLQFNGANVAETITIQANGGRTLFFRDVAAVTMDLNDTEVINFGALGGIDTIMVNDLDGTDVTNVNLDLASTIGGGAGDGQADRVTLNGTGAANMIVLSGTAAALTVSGLPWSSVISQVEAPDSLTVLAGGGNDAISTAGIANGLVLLTLDGGAGNDVLQSTGDGTYLGGIGDDVIRAGLTSSSEILDGGDDIDTLDTRTWGGPYTINMVTGLTNYSGESFTNFENLVTGVGDDTITGTDGANVIRTTDGVDNVAAAGGNDIVEGGAGGDTLDGGADIDTLDYSTSSAGVTIDLSTSSASGGDATGDIISNFENVTGSASADVLTGNDGANFLNGGGGVDSLTGGLGDDFYVVDNAADAVTELVSGGSDRVLASVSYALAAGLSVEALTTSNNAGTAAINLTGNEIANALVGNAGANTLDGRGAADIMAGLGGNDFYFVDNVGDRALESAGLGSDRVFAAVSWTLEAGSSVETISTTDNAGTTAINLNGNELAQTIFGNDGANQLDGKGGADVLAGRLGDDFYFIDNGSDQVVEAAGQGNDRVFAAASWVLAAGVSVETLSTNFNAGTAAINLTGNELANTIIGNDGGNVLNGGGGVDAMAGRLGDDFYFVDNAADRVVETAGQGSDRIVASLSWVLAAGLSVETLTTSNGAGTTAIDLTGNEIANAIVGNAGANMLDGKGDADTMFGQAGDDLYFVDNAGDRAVEAAGQGNDRVFAGVSWALEAGSSVETISTTNNAGTIAINLTGNEFANLVIGNDGANALNGGAGADVLDGRLGDDFYFVDTALDQVIEGAGAGNDRVAASVSYALAAGVSVETLSTTLATGTTTINLTGNELANTIFGNNGVNILNGGAGVDSMTGLGGDDFYFVDDAGDRAVETAGQGSDRVLASVSYALEAGSSVEILVTTDSAGTTAINLTGNEIAQSIVGNAGANTLNGGGGADIMAGLGGDDFYFMDNGGDRAMESAGGGTDRVFAGVSWTLEAGSSVETIGTTSNAGTTAINLTGNELVQTILGNDGVNVLDGKGGADALMGRAGADTFAFTTALGAGNVDRLLDMQAGTDRIALDDAIFTGIGPPGALDAAAFVTGAAAADASDRIVYNNATGQLFFDADGTGGVAQVLFATLDGNPALSAADFTVI
jgi:Ca2+-binding RTX toxin-like protein